MDNRIIVTDKDIKIAKMVELSAKAVNAVLGAENKCQKAREALASDDKLFTYQTLQEYLNKYESFINGTTFITGKKVIKVSPDFYDTQTIDEIKQQIRLIIGFVYGKVATESAMKEIFKDKLKRELANSKLLDKDELRLLGL